MDVLNLVDPWPESSIFEDGRGAAGRGHGHGWEQA